MTLDHGERALGCAVEAMDEYDLMVYCQEQAKRRFGRAIPTDGAREVTQLKWLKRVYGADAGPLLKYIFEERKGKIKDRPFTFSMLARNWRPVLDDLYSDLKDSKQSFSVTDFLKSVHE